MINNQKPLNDKVKIEENTKNTNINNLAKLIMEKSSKNKVKIL